MNGNIMTRAYWDCLKEIARSFIMRRYLRKRMGMVWKERKREEGRVRFFET